MLCLSIPQAITSYVIDTRLTMELLAQYTIIAESIELVDTCPLLYVTLRLAQFDLPQPPQKR